MFRSTRPAIEYGDSEPRTRWVSPCVAGLFDPNILQPQGATTRSLAGRTEFTHWHIARGVILELPELHSWDRAELDCHMADWILRGKVFRLYPDYRADTYYTVQITPGWVPQYTEIAGYAVCSLTISMTRTDAIV